MRSRLLFSCLLTCCLLLQLTACSDEARETALIDLHTTAAQDVVSLQFPADTETVISVNSQTALSVLGLKSNAIDSVSLSSEIKWSLSANARSQISSNGVISAGPVAESLTVTATLGILSTSIDIRVSAAKFDQVISLNALPLSLDMCQSRQIQPQARYIDASGNTEERKLDNTLINSIEWIILNASDLSISHSAYIETVNNVTTLYGLEATNVIIRARATSTYSGTLVTSGDISQDIGSALDSIKLCYSTANDYTSCSVSSPHIEQDKSLSFIAVGNYPSNTSSPYQNITRTTKWGLSNNYLSAVLSQDMQQIAVTGEQELQTSTLSYACGEIQQSISGIDIAQGIILNSSVDCASNCQGSSTPVTIDRLSVSSLDVSANATQLTHNQALTLTAPLEIEFVVTAHYSNGEQADITSDSSLSYYIINIDGQPTVIEAVAGTPGSYTVLNSGTAKIQLDYRGKTFIAIIEIL